MLFCGSGGDGMGGLGRWGARPLVAALLAVTVAVAAILLLRSGPPHAEPASSQGPELDPSKVIQAVTRADVEIVDVKHAALPFCSRRRCASCRPSRWRE